MNGIAIIVIAASALFRQQVDAGLARFTPGELAYVRQITIAQSAAPALCGGTEMADTGGLWVTTGNISLFESERCESGTSEIIHEVCHALTPGRPGAFHTAGFWQCVHSHGSTEGAFHD